MKPKNDYIRDYLKNIPVGTQFIIRDVVEKLSTQGYYISTVMVRKHMESLDMFRMVRRDNKVKASIWEKIR